MRCYAQRRLLGQSGGVRQGRGVHVRQRRAQLAARTRLSECRPVVHEEHAHRSGAAAPGAHRMLQPAELDQLRQPESHGADAELREDLFGWSAASDSTRHPVDVLTAPCALRRREVKMRAGRSSLSRTLLIIRLFQQATICRVGAWRAHPFLRICTSFDVNSQPKKPANDISRHVDGRMVSCVHAARTGVRTPSRSGAGSVPSVGIRCR